MTDELEPFFLDRQLHDACRAWRRWRRELRQGSGYDDDPLQAHRSVSSRTTFQAMTDLGDRDPLAPYLRRWVYRLAEQRINAQAIASVEAARRLQTYVIDEPDHAQLSLAAIWAQALRDEARRRAWLESYLANSQSLSARIGLLWERRAEIARRMGAVDLNAIELCQPELTDVARALLERTDDMAEAFRGRELADHLTLALGHDLDEGWPARLTLRSLVELFSETSLFQGLSLDTGPFPSALAGSSFLRGLLRLGASWVRATAPQHQPFAVAHDPYALPERRMGALFVAAACSPAFMRRVCGISGTRLRARTRAAGRVVLLHARTLALRVVLRSAALEGRKAFARAFEADAERAFGLGLPGVAAGSLFRMRIDDGASFASVLLAAKQHSEWTDEHDEDWFRNPRAVDRLRSEAELSPEITCSKADLQAGTAALRSALLDALG
ncbi:MAG TPA: hypothetical protein VI072_05065 [Polyangiaceae bacterium]